MIENKKIMAKNILKYMNAKNVSSAEICKALNFKQSTFSDWVHARRYPRIDSIEKMANYFGVSKAYLVEDEETRYFSDEEIGMIIEYRKADTETKAMINRLLAYSKHLSNEKNTDCEG